MGVGAAILGAAVIGGGASIASGAIGSSAATSAANTQAQAAQYAAQLQLQEYNQTVANLTPFRTAGVNALTQLQNLTGTNTGGNPLTAPLTTPFQPTIAQLAQTPGYQFTLDQGLKATQNAFAASGLGESGAAQKGAVNYAEGLAGTTYQQQFQNYLNQNAQIYNMLNTQASTGLNAAALQGSQGISAVGAVGNNLTSGAAASAAGTIGSTNAITNALSGIAGTGTNTALLLALNNSGMFGAMNNPNGLTGTPTITGPNPLS